MTDSIAHDALYDEPYYVRDVHGPAVLSAPAMARSIIETFRPCSVVDVGCGTGALLRELSHRADRQLLGLEYSTAALSLCDLAGLPVRRFDIESDQPPCSRGYFDLAVSFEVAEHLPARAAARFVDLLIWFSRTIVITAAPPGQGGVGHVNEQPQSYWIDLFEARGYRHRRGLSDHLHGTWKAGGAAGWYADNVMVFRA